MMQETEDLMKKKKPEKKNNLGVEIGGTFKLKDTNAKEFTEKNLRGLIINIRKSLYYIFWIC